MPSCRMSGRRTYPWVGVGPKTVGGWRTELLAVRRVSRWRLGVVVLAAGLASGCATFGSWAASQTSTSSVVGRGEVRVHFRSSAGPAAQAALDRGVQALHDFWHAEAMEQFHEALRLDPELVLATFGETLAVHDPFGLGECDPEPLREVLGRLGPDSSARAAKGRTPREVRFIAAVETLAGEGDTETRHRAFAAAMRGLAEDFPDDLEALAFYALSLFGTADNLRKYPELREEVAAVTATILAREPLHPGGLHYAIHALDTPGEAHRVLDIARRYREVAAAPHAIHMSSHIFLQHGLFEDSIAVNESAFELSERWARETDRSASSLDWHAADFLHYSLLQLGRVKEAKRWEERLDAALESEDNGMLQFYRGAWAARSQIERRDLRRTIPASGFGTRQELLAQGLQAIEHGDEAGLKAVQAEVASAIEETANDRGAFGTQARWQVLGAQIEALRHSRLGEHEAAVASARRAVAFGDTTPPPNETPDPLIPPRELLGDVLLAAGRPAEAARAYTEALELWHGRLRSMAGFARASEAAGLLHASRSAYRSLADQLAKGDAIPERAEAISKVGRE